jgi:hypothetical protein
MITRTRYICEICGRDYSKKDNALKRMVKWLRSQNISVYICNGREAIKATEKLKRPEWPEGPELIGESEV